MRHFLALALLSRKAVSVMARAAMDDGCRRRGSMRSSRRPPGATTRAPACAPRSSPSWCGWCASRRTRCARASLPEAAAIVVSLPSVYNTLEGIPPAIAAAVVQESGRAGAEVIDQMGGRRPPGLPSSRD